MGGGTEFPELKLEDSIILARSEKAGEESSLTKHIVSIPHNEHSTSSKKLGFWKERVEVEDAENQTLQFTKGTIFKPRKGCGIFWVNLHETGFGDQRVRHAGLPVHEGEKIGMNIWVKRDFGW